MSKELNDGKSKRKPTIKPLGDNLYQIIDGQVRLVFGIDEKYQITVYKDNNGGEFKEFRFIASKPMLVLKIGRTLKYAAGYALQQKESAEKKS